MRADTHSAERKAMRCQSYEMSKSNADMKRAISDFGIQHVVYRFGAAGYPIRVSATADYPPAIEAYINLFSSAGDANFRLTDDYKRGSIRSGPTGRRRIELR